MTRTKKMTLAFVFQLTFTIATVVTMCCIQAPIAWYIQVAIALPLAISNYCIMRYCFFGGRWHPRQPFDFSNIENEDEYRELMKGSEDAVD